MIDGDLDLLLIRSRYPASITQHYGSSKRRPLKGMAKEPPSKVVTAE